MTRTPLVLRHLAIGDTFTFRDRTYKVIDPDSGCGAARHVLAEQIGSLFGNIEPGARVLFDPDLILLHRTPAQEPAR
jgi:hypothetical protein